MTAQRETVCHAKRLGNEVKLHTAVLTFSGTELSRVEPIFSKAPRTLESSWEVALEGSGALLS